MNQITYRELTSNKTANLMVRISAKLKDKLDKLSLTTNRSLTAVIEDICIEYLERNKLL